MNLMGLMCTKSRDSKRYVLVVIDDFSRYSFVSFLREKLETIDHLKSLLTKIQLQINHPIIRIRSDRRKEFENVIFNLFCKSKMIKQ